MVGDLLSDLQDALTGTNVWMPPPHSGAELPFLQGVSMSTST